MSSPTLRVNLVLLSTLLLLHPGDAHPLEGEQTDVFLDQDTASEFLGDDTSSEVNDFLESITENVEDAWEKVKEVFEEITDFEIVG